MKPIGFMSENTAAYALMPDLVSHLSAHHRRIIPLRFSSTREGARTADESMGDRRVKVLAAYARRPKVTHAGDETILIKLNSLLFASARAGAGFGIPVLAGVPLVSSLLHLSIGVPCAWFLLEPVEQADTEFNIRLSQPREVENPVSGVSGPLTREEIADVAASKCREMAWMLAAEGMRSVRDTEQGYRGPFGAGYTPFFLAMTANDVEAPTTA
jgi:hypothetical protein